MFHKLQWRGAYKVEVRAAGQRHVGVLREPDDVLRAEEHIVEEQHSLRLPLAASYCCPAQHASGSADEVQWLTEPQDWQKRAYESLLMV